MLTDCYKKLYDGYVFLSGKSDGASGVTEKTIAELFGGNSIVEFKNIDEEAVSLVTDRLKENYVENEEGFIIVADKNVTVYADSDRAKLYAASAIKDMYNDGLERGIWWAYPMCSHRSIRIFLPPKSEINYFYQLVDQMVHLGYNEMLLEICGALEFKRHPEINKAWLDYCASVHEYPEKYSLVGRAYYRTKNSVHTCNAGGGVYSHEEMRELVKYCKDRFIEVVPEVPSLSHSEYILVAHPELRECDDEPFAATACPSNPELNKLVFDLYDEVIDVFEPCGLHIGHDEWWNMCVCDRCKDKDPNELYVNNVLESYNYLKDRGIKTYMWADKLFPVTDKLGESHGAAGKEVYSVPTKKEPQTVEIMGKKYPLYDRYWFEAPEWVKKEGFRQVIREMDCAHMLPPDIMYLNWYFVVDPTIRNTVFERQGKDMVLANAHPDSIINYKQRFEHGAQGFSVSSWGETSELNMQSYGTIYQMGYGSIIAWNHKRTELMHEKNVYDTFDILYKLRNREVLKGPHLEVTHAVVREWKDGRKYYFSMEKADKDFLTIGEYRVTYKNGGSEVFPVIFSINITHRDLSFERCESTVNWCYTTNPDYSIVASVCNVEKEADGVWYTTVMPISSEVEGCEYIPKAGFEDYVEIKSIKIMQ